MRGGENRKTEIQNEGVGGRRIFIYVFIYYNLQRWSKGGGGLGVSLCPCHAALAHCPKVTVTCTPCPYNAHQSPVPAGLPLTH